MCIMYMQVLQGPGTYSIKFKNIDIYFFFFLSNTKAVSHELLIGGLKRR